MTWVLSWVSLVLSTSTCVGVMCRDFSHLELVGEHPSRGKDGLQQVLHPWLVVSDAGHGSREGAQSSSLCGMEGRERPWERAASPTFTRAR